ncbi:MAG: hypothetical protein U5J63_09505 [Fodinibius sp.]|nr:hypothetical protein [Fodinibius sp.]
MDIFKLEPSPYLTENEIAAANTVTFEQLNAQGQPKYDWPATFVLAKAYLDQIERHNGLSMDKINSARLQLYNAENASGSERSDMLNELASEMESEVSSSSQSDKVRKLTNTLEKLASK